METLQERVTRKEKTQKFRTRTLEKFSRNIPIEYQVSDVISQVLQDLLEASREGKNLVVDIEPIPYKLRMTR